MPELKIHDLSVNALTPAAFAPFGHVMAPLDDGVMFGEQDARLHFGAGTPRFYTMRLPNRGLVIRRITRHRDVTQVLASAGGVPWFIAVAAPPVIDGADAEPELAGIMAFRVPGDVAVMLNRGTWHAGPLFMAAEANFFNLELSDTNMTDHWDCDLGQRFGVALRLTAEGH